MHEDVLNKRYNESVQTVLNEMEKVIPRIKLTGQWSIDVMREREKINQYVKDNGAFVSKDLVPMSLLQSVVSYGWECWNQDFPE